MNQCNCDGCENGMEAMHSKHAELMKKYGWMIHFVTPDEEYPFNVNIHTHGFPEKFNHQDMQICAPITMTTAQGIMNTIGRRLAKMEVFKPNNQYKEIIEKFPILIRSAKEGEREVLRIVLPDKNGSFETRFSKLQIADIKRFN